MADSSPTNNGSNSQPVRQEHVSNYWFARLSKSIMFLVIALVIIGAYLAISIPISVFPSTNFPRIIIGADNGVMPIDQMLVTITRPLEEAVNSVQGLNEVASITSRGSAEIDLYFDWNVDMFQTLARVNAAIARIQGTLPPTVAIKADRLQFSSFPIMFYSLTSETVPPTRLWEMATYAIKPRLNRLPGVATVLVQGGQVPEFGIAPNPLSMVRTGVTVSDILNSVSRTNLLQSPGLLTFNHQLYLGLVSGQVSNPPEISDIVVKNAPDGTPIRIADVAHVGSSVAPNYTIVTSAGKPAVTLFINRQPHSNTVRVASEVRTELTQIEKTLPQAVRVSNNYDQSWIIGESIKSVRDAIIIGLILAAIIMVLFLQDWGTSLVAGMVIPGTILITFVVMKMLGMTFNMMTLGGLAAAVGLVIDDAIVMVENIVLHREAGEGRLESIDRAIKELAKPLIGSTLTPIVVFVPLIAITGVTGVFFKALALTVGIALFISLCIALVWTPNLSLHFLHKDLSRKPKDEDGKAGVEREPGETEHEYEMRRLMEAEEASMSGSFGGVIRFYEKWFQRGLNHPGWLALMCGALIVVSFICYKSLGSGLLPEMDEGGFVLDYVTPPGASLAETNRMITHIIQIIDSVPEVASVSRRTGLQLGLAAVTEANTGDIAIKLKVNRHRNIWQVMDEVRAKVTHAEPAVDVDFTQKLQDMIGDLTGAPQPIDIMMFSSNAELLDTWAPKVADAITNAKLNGKNPIVDVDNGIDSTTSGPAVAFHVNVAKAAQAGFSTDEVATDAEAVLDGVPAPAPVVINNRPFTLRVRFPEQYRSSLAAMSNVPLVSATGGTGTLGSLASITTLPGQTEILRDNQQRYVAVTARLEGLDLGSGVSLAQKTVAGLHLPSSIRIEYGGLYKLQQQSFHDLLEVLILAILLVFLVLIFEFQSFSAP
ncbi:MAG: efflux RND transporter permease subunit, partial [Terriglobia bacterium]